MNVHGKIIVVRRNGTDSAHFPLTSNCCVFGRNQECDIRIQLPSVDEEQCRVEVDNKGHVFAKNLSKSTPTLVNDKALSDNLTALSHGDIISIVGRRFRFEFPANSRFYPQKSPKGKSPKSPGMSASTPGSASKSPRSSGRTPKPLSPRTDNVPDTKAAKSPQAETKSSPRTPALLKNSASAHASPDFLFGLSPTSFYKVSVTPKGLRKLSDVHQSKTATPVFNMTPSTSAQTPLLFKDIPVASPAKKAVGSPYAKSNASLRKSISDLRRKSMPVVETEEDSSTPSKITPVRETEKPQQLSGTKRRYSEFVIPSSKRKRVSFGPSLSPEHFDKCLPPKTPIKKGATPSRISQGPKSLLKRKSPKNNTSLAKSPSPGKRLTPSQASKQVLSESPVQPSSVDAAIVNDSSFSNNENIKTTPKRRSLSRSPPADRKSPKASSPVLEIVNIASTSDEASLPDTDQIVTPEKHDVEKILSDKSKSADRGTVGKVTAKPNGRRVKSLGTSPLSDTTTIVEKKVQISAVSPKSHSPHVKTPIVKRAGGLGKTNKKELDISLTGVKELLKTPKTLADVSFTGISPLFKTPNEAQKSQKRNANLNNSTPKMVKPANYIDTPRPNFSEKRNRSPKKFFDEIASTSSPVKSPKSPLLGTPSWKSKKLERSESPMKIATPPQDLNKVVALRAIHGHAATPKLSALQKRGNTPAKSAKKTQDSAKKPPTVKTWSDIVKAGPALPAKPLPRPAVLTKFPAVKKRSPVAVKTVGKTPKTPRALARALAPTTGHAESPATIIVGKKALGRIKPKTPQPLPRKGRKKSMGKVSRVSLGNVSLTGVAEMFNSPQSSDPNESALYADIPDTPNGPNEMFVSPLSGSKSQHYSKGRQSINLTGVRDLFKNKRKSVDPSLVGVKELMKSPAQRSDVSPTGLKRLMKTPKNTSVSPTGVAELFAAHESSTPVSRKSLSKTQESAKKANIAGSPGMASAVEQELTETVTTEQSEDSSSTRKNKTPIKAQASPVARRDSKKHASPKVAENVPLVSSSPVLAAEKENDQNSSATVETAIITDVTEAKGAEQPAQPARRTPSGKRNRTMSPVSKGADAITPIKETQTTGAKVNKKVGFNVPVALENSVTKRGRARLPKVVSEADKTAPSVVPSKSRNRKTAETIVEHIPVSAAAPARGRRKSPQEIEQVPVEPQVNAAPTRGRRKDSATTEQVQVPVLETEVVEKPVMVEPPSRGRRKAPVVAEEVPVITESEEKTVAAPSRGRRKTPVVTEEVPVPMVSKTVPVEEKPVEAAPLSRGRRKTPVVTEEVPVPIVTKTVPVEEKPVAAAPPSRGRRKTPAVTEEVAEITESEEKIVAAAPPSRGRRKTPIVPEEVPVVIESVKVSTTASTRGKRKNAVVPEQVPAPVVSESQVAEKPVAAAAPSRGRRKNAEATVEAQIPVTAEVQSRSSKRGSKVIEAEEPAESQTVRKRKEPTEVEAPTKKSRTGKETVASNAALSEVKQERKSRSKSVNNEKEKISPVKPRGRRAAVSPVKEMVVSDTLKKKSDSAGQEPEVTKARGTQNKADEPLPKSRTQSNKEVPVTETVSIQATRKGRGKQSAEPAANIQELPTAEAPPTRNSRIKKAAEVVDVPTITQETAAKRGRGRQAAVSSITEAPKNTPPLEEPQEKSRNSRTKKAIEVPVVEQASARGKRKNPPETVEAPAPEVSAISKPMKQKSKGQSAEAVVAQSKQTNVSKRKAAQVVEAVSPPKRRKITESTKADQKPLETDRAKRSKGTSDPISQEKPQNTKKVKQPTIAESSSPVRKQTTRGQKKVDKTTATTAPPKVSLRQRH